VAGYECAVAVLDRPVLVGISVSDVVGRGDLIEVDAPLARVGGSDQRDPRAVEVDDLRRRHVLATLARF
jgi:hypothetical protein